MNVLFALALTPGDDCSGAGAWDDDASLDVTETTVTISDDDGGCATGGAGLWLLALAAVWRRGEP